MSWRWPVSTVSAVLARIGLGKLSRLEPPEPPNRYERERPGELVHIDVKKLGRIRGARASDDRQPREPEARQSQRHAERGVAGWEFVHVCVDDATRLAYVEVLADEKGLTAVGFLRRAIAFYRRHGITVERVMTDNGTGLPLHRPRARLPRAAASATCAPGPTGPAPTARPQRFIRTLLAAVGPTARFYGTSPRTHRRP